MPHAWQCFAMLHIVHNEIPFFKTLRFKMRLIVNYKSYAHAVYTNNYKYKDWYKLSYYTA